MAELNFKPIYLGQLALVPNAGPLQRFNGAGFIDVDKGKTGSVLAGVQERSHKRLSITRDGKHLGQSISRRSQLILNEPANGGLYDCRGLLIGKRTVGAATNVGRHLPPWFPNNRLFLSP
jgi:hypothetical protein